MGIVTTLVIRPRCGEQTFIPPTHWGFNLPSGFWGEGVWRMWTMDVDRQTMMDGQTTKFAYFISSSMSLKALVS